MKTTETTGKTVEEAVMNAVRELNVPMNEVKVTVLEEPNKGLFGIIGSKMARVKVTWEENKVKKATAFLENVFRTMGIDAKIDVIEEGENIRLDIKGKRLGLLIGKRGQTLDSLQYLTNLIANKNSEERQRFILDAENYRQRREETLRNLALRLADKVIRSGRKLSLEPMNAHERRIIHNVLQDVKEVVTHSEGEEPFRKIVITPVRKNGESGKKYKEV
jgi:spoIIIJ-associated protein